MIRFESVGDNETRVDIRLLYNPPGGVLGHLAALLFGADPKSAMDDDLMRFKSIIESGRTRGAGDQATASRIESSGHSSRNL
jgi:uncharacterized membrane protein